MLCCAESLHHVRLFDTPCTRAHQAPLSIGLSKQEYWSGLPCPPPGDLPNPGIGLGDPALQGDCLPSEPPEKPNNTRVGSLSLLQGNFPTQESNWGLMHCRQILYQLPGKAHMKTRCVTYICTHTHTHTHTQYHINGQK